MSNLLKNSVTLGPIGYLPAPGTFGTLVTMPVVMVLHQYSLSWEHWLVLCVSVSLIAYCGINCALPLFKKSDDPSEIVLDEVVGCLVTFSGITINYVSLIVGFFLFRFFDIKKPFFIQSCEQLPGALGIMSDDIAAGIAANLVLRIVNHIFCVLPEIILLF